MSKRTEADELRARVNELKASVSALDAGNVRLSKALRAEQRRSSEMEAVQQERDDLAAALKQSRAEVSQLRAGLDAANAKLDRAESIIDAARRIKSALAEL